MPLPLEIAIVPTVSDLEDKWGLRKEALRSLGVTEKTAAISAAFDEVCAALGKRAKRPVLLIDDFLKSLMCRLASAALLGWRRGMNPRAGQDQWILTELERMELDLENIRSGRVEPYFEDSSPNVDEQGPYGGGDMTADAWARCRHCCLGSCVCSGLVMP
jgi:hypothetical protein